MHARAPANECAGTDVHMARQHDVVRQCHLRTHLAVMTDVAVGHKKAVFPHHGRTALLAWLIDRHAFAQHRACANGHATDDRFTTAHLRLATDLHKAVDLAVLAKVRAAAHNDVLCDPRSSGNADTRFDNGIGANADVGRQLGRRMHDSSGMDHGGLS